MILKLVGLSEGSNYVVFWKIIAWEADIISMYARGERDPITFGPNLLCFVGRYLKKVGMSDQGHKTQCP